MYGISLMVALFGLALFTSCVSVKPISELAVMPEQQINIDEHEPVNLKTAVAVALAVDPDIQAARHRVSAAYWDKVQASLPSNPSLTFAVDPTEWTTLLATGISDLADVGGRRQKRVDAAQSREEQVVIEVIRRRIEVVRRVRLLYAEILARVQITELLEQKSQIQEQMLDLIRRMHESGDVDRLHVIAAERNGAEVNVAIAEQRNLRQRAEARLNRYLRRPLNAEITLTENFELENFVFSVDESISELGTVVRPELLHVTLRIAEHESLLSLARVAWMPDVNGGPYITGENGAMEGGGEVSITLPVFDGGKARSARERAVLSSLRAELAAVQAELLLDIHDAWLAVRRAELQATTLVPELVALAAAEFRVTEQMEKTGEASHLQVLLAQSGQLDAGIASAEAILAWRGAQIALAAAMGDEPQKSATGTDHNGGH